MAMVFTLITTLKEAAEQLILERQTEIDDAKAQEAAAAEAEENRKFEGTKVTIETFLEWSARFKAEMAEAKRKAEEAREAEEKRKRGPKEEKKMSGRELWIKGLAGKVMEDEEDDGVDVLEGMKALKVEG